MKLSNSVRGAMLLAATLGLSGCEQSETESQLNNTRANTAQVLTSDVSTINGVPVATLQDVQCEGNYNDLVKKITETAEFQRLVSTSDILENATIQTIINNIAELVNSDTDQRISKDEMVEIKTVLTTGLDNLTPIQLIDLMSKRVDAVRSSSKIGLYIFGTVLMGMLALAYTLHLKNHHEQIDLAKKKEQGDATIIREKNKVIAKITNDNTLLKNQLENAKNISLDREVNSKVMENAVNDATAT